MDVHGEFSAELEPEVDEMDSLHHVITLVTAAPQAEPTPGNHTGGVTVVVDELLAVVPLRIDDVAAPPPLNVRGAQTIGKVARRTPTRGDSSAPMDVHCTVLNQPGIERRSVLGVDARRGNPTWLFGRSFRGLGLDGLNRSIFLRCITYWSCLLIQKDGLDNRRRRGRTRRRRRNTLERR
jgi:hypothetical protein